MKNKYFLLIVVSVLLTSFVLAAHVITTSSGATSYNFNEDVSNLYNISVNITDLGQNANVTQVNITLPSNFSFLTNSQSTSAQNYSFVNTSSVLSWTNSTYFLINGSGGSILTYFWFNAIASTPGNYNITVTTVNGTGTFNSNISVTINDTTAPSLNFVSPSHSASSNLSYNNSILVNVTAVDNVNLSTIVIRLFNSSHAQINSSNSTTSPLFINFTNNLAEGVYRVNVTANDSVGNVNNSETRIITIDKTVPSISLSKNSATSSTSVLNITATITDVTGANSCSTSRGSISGSGNTRYVSETGLNCGTSYTYNVSCTDFAGNSGSSTSSFSTDSCASSSSGSGTTTTTSTFWIGTFVDSDVEFSDKKSVSREVRAKERIQIKINSTLHHIGIITLTSVDAVINVSSTPQQAVLSIGQSKKFEVSDDSYYDLNVTLVSINSTKANITVEYIYEKIPETIIPVSVETNASGNESLAQEIKGEIMDKIGLFKDKKVIVITTGIIALVGAVVISFYLVRKGRLKKPKVKAEAMQNYKRVSYTDKV